MFLRKRSVYFGFLISIVVYKRSLRKMKLEIFILVCCVLVGFTCLEEEISTTQNIENLNIAELLQLKLSDDTVYRQANAVYKRKFGHLPVEIFRLKDTYIGDKKIEGPHNHAITVNDDSIDVGFKAAVTFLMAFGQSIETLSIVDVGDEQENIGYLVNNYCSETLVEFKIYVYTEDAFDKMRKPFKNVKRTLFNGRWEKLSENSMKFDQLFPNLHILQVITDRDNHIFDYTLPHLEKMIAKEENSTKFFNFIQRNEHIKELELRKPTMELLKIVSKKLPKLEFFEFVVPFDIQFSESRNIIFEHYENVAIKNDYYDHILGRIEFKKLKNLQLGAIDRVDDVWADFIRTNNGLETLVITEGYFLNSALLKLSTTLNSLIEADISCYSDIEVETIAKFLENNPKMTKIKITFHTFVISFIHSLTVRIRDEWNITPINQSADSFNINRRTDSDEAPNNGALYLISSKMLTTLLLITLAIVSVF